MISILPTNIKKFEDNKTFKLNPHSNFEYQDAIAMNMENFNSISLMEYFESRLGGFIPSIQEEDTHKHQGTAYLAIDSIELEDFDIDLQLYRIPKSEKIILIGTEDGLQQIFTGYIEKTYTISKSDWLDFQDIFLESFDEIEEEYIEDEEEPNPYIRYGLSEKMFV